LETTATTVKNLKQQMSQEAVARDEILKENFRLAENAKHSESLKQALQKQVDSMRSSLLASEEAASSKSQKIQEELIIENKTYRSQVESLQNELSSKSDDNKKLGNVISTLEQEKKAIEAELDSKSSKIAKLQEEFENLEQSLQTERHRLAEQAKSDKSDNQSSENSLREQMAKMQERLNMTELEKLQTSTELSSIKSDNETLEDEFNKLSTNHKILIAESEKSQAELNQLTQEHSKLKEKYSQIVTDAEARQTKESVPDSVESSELVIALQQELRVLREKNQILETNYKLSRRISPRAVIKAGKTIDPPPLAPSSCYVSSDDHSQIDEKQLKVLRTELRQREELVSRLVADVESMKVTLNKKDQETTRIREEYSTLSADYSANLVLIDEYEKSDTTIRKELRKAKSQIEGTYDGDEDLKQMIKEKIEEIQNLQHTVSELRTIIHTLKKSLSRRRRRMKKSKEKSEVGDGSSLRSAPREDKLEVIPPEGGTVNPVDNPDEFVACSIQ